MAQSFVVLVVQQLILALGIALAGANAWALIQNRRRRKAYEREMAAFKDAKRTGRKVKKPRQPEMAQVTPAVVNIVIGSAIALVAIASLTFDWVT